MNDEIAFLAAIKSASKDDVVRIVFADWLQERNDPRAEYLQLEFEITCLIREGRTVASELLDQSIAWERNLDREWVHIIRRPLPLDPAQIRDWREFYKTLNIELGYGTPVPKPTIAHLDQFETETGFRLPRSYREFILVFGPGKLCSDWRIAAPGYGSPWFWDLHAMQENTQSHQQWIERFPESHRERVQRCRYFCSKYKDAFGWDPTECRDSDASEYTVYRICEDRRVLHVADSFRGFVEDAMLDILTCPGWDEDELGPKLLFEPAMR